MAVVVLLAGVIGVAAEPSQGLTRSESQEALRAFWEERRAELEAERSLEMEERRILLSDKILRWVERVYGSPTSGGPSLWISLHGGGGAPPEVNDRQWRNQADLYQPEEGIYVAPRGPTDHWNLWHEAHVDPMFDRLIEDYIVLRGVDPNRVYLLGYSAGGDGVWQLAPRMADRWAAAAMMAGHPNDASLLPLRNVPFALFVGAEDSAYQRNRVVAERAAELDRLQAADPGGYVHLARVYPGLPHWMNRRDAEALPWMARHLRRPWPRRVVWVQDDVPHTRFYWLTMAESDARPGRQVIGEVEGQIIRLMGDVPDSIGLRLSDDLLDLDQPIRIVIADREVHHGPVARSRRAIREGLWERADPAAAACAFWPEGVRPETPTILPVLDGEDNENHRVKGPEQKDTTS